MRVTQLSILPCLEVGPLWLSVFEKLSVMLLDCFLLSLDVAMCTAGIDDEMLGFVVGKCHEPNMIWAAFI